MRPPKTPDEKNNIPRKIDPPATPPLRFSTSEPGLFTSNERMTISRAADEKSRRGTGTFLQIYSQTTLTAKGNLQLFKMIFDKA